MVGQNRTIPVDSLLQLRQRLDRLPCKSHERVNQVADVANLYGISSATVYRSLQDLNKPYAVHRADHGKPRILPQAELERYCELISALKLRTTNKNGRHLSTVRTIELLENFGLETNQGLVQAPKGLLTRSTVNRYLEKWHLSQTYLMRESAAVRFQAEHSNDCWQFDISPSDLKHIDKPDWIDLSKGQPTLAIFSVVDDRSGAAYQEYHCIYGFDDTDLSRLLNYVEAFDQFFEKHKQTVSEFSRGWKIDLVADGENIRQINNKLAYDSIKSQGKVKRVSWQDFLYHAKKVHEQFLDVHDLGRVKNIS